MNSIQNKKCANIFCIYVNLSVVHTIKPLQQKVVFKFIFLVKVISIHQKFVLIFFVCGG